MKKSFEIILVSILLVQNVSPILINAEKVVNNIQESKKSTKSTSNQAKKDLLYNPQAPRGYVVDSKTNFKPNVSGKVNIINNLYDIDGPKDIIKGDDYVTTEQTTNNELTPGSEYTLSGGTVGGYNRHLENSINIAFDTSSGVDPNAKVTIMYPEALNIDGKLIDVELELSKFETYGNGTVNISDRLYYGQMYCGGMHGADVKYSLYEKGTTTPAEFGKNTRFILKQSSYVNSNSFISTYPDSGVDVVYNTGFTTSYNESTGVTVYDGVAEGTIGLYLKEDTSQFKYRYRNILGSGILLPGVLVSTSVPDEIFSDENKNGRLELNEDLNVKIKLENLKSVNDVNLPIQVKTS